MLFDEATSHLDTVTEQVVEESLSALACTRIIIAHRLSTVRDADLVIVLENGAIVEQGTPRELMRHNGYYRRLVQHQLDGEVPRTTQSLSEVTQRLPVLEIKKRYLHAPRAVDS
jgi:ABC-type transport system involved in cytochrome bd biosynthesis fused ATPase/permease subunit